MAPFLDPGSRVFDDPEAYGYKLRAKTLEEHRERLVMPSWKHIMNYESDAMTADELVDATYDAGWVLNRVKVGRGHRRQTARVTEQRIVAARGMKERIDGIMAGDSAQVRERLAA